MDLGASVATTPVVTMMMLTKGDLLNRRMTQRLKIRSCWKLIYHQTGRSRLEACAWKAPMVRPDGCMYYAISGNCRKGIKCKNADAHTPKGYRRTVAWLLAKLNKSRNQAPQGPVKIMTKEHPVADDAPGYVNLRMTNTV